jgi:hypothetical protein
MKPHDESAFRSSAMKDIMIQQYGKAFTDDGCALGCMLGNALGCELGCVLGTEEG